MCRVLAEDDSSKYEMKSRLYFLLLILFSVAVLLAILWFTVKSRTRSDTTRSAVVIGDRPYQRAISWRESATSTEYRREYLPSSQTEVSAACDACKYVDVQSFKSWNQGVVTLMEPVIPRNCEALFNGDQKEFDRVASANQNWDHSVYNHKFNELFDTEDCSTIRTEFEGNFYISDEELSFPLAFSMNVHDNPQQIVRFLKVIYRPQNVYCIHYDQKSNDTFKNVFNTLAKCLRNVIIPKKIVNVVYGCYPILEAQLSCMSDLLEVRSSYPWKYTTTLCGKEVPLRTNREMVRFLQKMKGLPAIFANKFSSSEYSLKLHYYVINKKNKCRRTPVVHQKPIPYGMELLKTMAYVSLTPEFTDFILHSSEAKALYDFVRPITGPEEAFYGTLLHYWMNGKYYMERIAQHFIISASPVEM